MRSIINIYIRFVIPAKAGIQERKKLDARLKTSGMTSKISTRVKINNVMYILLLIFLFTGAVTASAETPVQEQGKALYEKYCLVCHGEKGDGKGSAARYLFPRPRDLSVGVFKIRSTSTGDPPTDSDLISTITEGMPGSSMPTFTELSKEEKTALVEYVKELGEIEEDPVSIIRPGSPPKVTPELIAMGKEVYKKVKCGECHGETGEGDGPKADILKDDWNQPSPPNAFTRGIYKGGAEPADIYLRFTAGLDGNPMPSYEDSLTDKERWAVVFYTLSLAGPAVARQPTSGRIVAKKVPDDIPNDPESALWKGSKALKIPLMLLWQKPDSSNRVIKVKALYNDKDIAFLLEWEDSTKSILTDINTFRDGAALQFPSEEGVKPSFWMGHGEGKEPDGIVNIWFWKADTQESIDKGLKPAPQSPVENLLAGGFGTLKFMKEDSQLLYGNGKWNGGRWRVVFKRTFNGKSGNARFAEGKLTPVSFALWDGNESDVDGRKAVSTWYYIIPEG